MKITGFCEKCHKIRTVRVHRFRPRTNVQTGICSSCELEEDRERQARFEKRQKGRKK